jgi:signal transduction histidine kinase/ligand-binding sensor domain-containing protein
MVIPVLRGHARRRALRCTPWRALWVGALGTLAGATAHAQARPDLPAPTLAQLAHRAWTIRDGAPGAVYALAQSADGFLWLGTGTGLFRFDGERFERFEPPAGQRMPSQVINTLLALPDGALWIGYALGGASVLAHGRIASYEAAEGLPAGTVTSLARDSSGTVWAATTRGLARFAAGRWQPVRPESGLPSGMVNELTVDRRGALWAAASAGVYVLSAGSGRFVRAAPPLAVGEREVGSGSVRAAPDGSVWSVALSRGVRRLADPRGAPQRESAVTDHARDQRSGRGWYGMYVDRHAHAWAIATDRRLVRVALTAGDAARPAARLTWETRTFTPAEGMSGSLPIAILEDREGSIWVGTDGGIDQFRAPKFTSTSWPALGSLPTIVAGDGGALWAGGLTRPLVAIGDRGGASPNVPAGTTAAYRDADGGVWVGGIYGLWHARGDGPFTRVALPPALGGGAIRAIARDRSGTLWVSGTGRDVYRQRGDGWERFGAPGSPALSMAPDGAGRMWLGYEDGRIVRASGDTVRDFGPGDGPAVGAVLTMHAHGGRVWAGGEFGIAVLDATDAGRDRRPADPRFAPLAIVGGTAQTISGIVETGNGDLWLHGAMGVTRVPAAEVTRALHDRRYRARAEHFDIRDGVGGPGTARPSATAVEGTDGRLWFAYFGGIAWIDPAHMRRNGAPPPVQVRSLTAGEREYAAAGPVALPERTTALRVAYTAYSLAVPERVRFRHRLVGLDTAWQDAAGRREAFYTNLGPGTYRFEVAAANDDGVWNTAGAALDVVIPPTFAQTNAFLALCAAAGGGTLWFLGAWRQRRVSAAARARSEAVLAERLRLARELHDTLLSDIAGVTMQLDAVTTRPPGGDPGALVAVVAGVRDQARRALDDARRAVVGLRTGPEDPVPLGVQLAAAADRVFAGSDIAVRCDVASAPHPVAEEVGEAVCRIIAEAMVNARAHAGCDAVEVTCGADGRALTVRVRDNGRGFDPAAAGADGHYGLVGMRERAAAIGARLTIESATGRGTEVRLVVPARTA